MLTQKEVYMWLKKKKGYQGLETKEACQEFCASKGIELTDDTTGDVLDWDAVFSQKASKPLVKEAVTVDEDEKEDETEVPSEKSQISRINSANTKKADWSFSIANMECKAYDRRAAQGKTVYGSSQEAQFNTAIYRLKAAKANNLSYGQKAFDMEVLGKDMSELVNSSGGAYFGDTFMNNVIAATQSYGAARKLANLQTISNGSNIFPRETGPISMYHTAQGDSITQADIGTDNVQLVPKEVAVILKTNNQLFESASVNVADRIAFRIGEAQLSREDDDFFNGDGSAQYGGQTGFKKYLTDTNTANGNTLTYFPIASGSTFKSVELDDVLNLMGSVQYEDPARCAWFCSSTVATRVLLRLAMEAGGAAVTDIVAGNPVINFLGKPVVIVQKMISTEVNTAPFLGYGDVYGAAMLGTRKNLEIMSSIHPGFGSNKTWTRGLSEIAALWHGDGIAGSRGPVCALKLN